MSASYPSRTGKKEQWTVGVAEWRSGQPASRFLRSDRLWLGQLPRLANTLLIVCPSSSDEKALSESGGENGQLHTTAFPLVHLGQSGRSQ
jgi:hypothetical protein